MLARIQCVIRETALYDEWLERQLLNMRRRIRSCDSPLSPSSKEAIWQYCIPSRFWPLLTVGGTASEPADLEFPREVPTYTEAFGSAPLFFAISAINDVLQLNP
jgi:hypothetical protein